MSSETPVIDDNVIADLRESVGGDDGFVVELAAAYLAESPGYLTALDDAVARGEIEAAVRPAHTLKSSSASLGAMRLSEIARGIEFAARDRRIDGLAEAVEQAKAVWADTVAAMKERGLAG